MEKRLEYQQSHLTHLTDAQFTELLLGANPAAVRAHLEGCPQCSEEADRVSRAIGSFEQQSRLWAERRAASQPILVSHRQPAFPWLHIPTNPQAWTAAFALAIALAVGIGVTVRNDHPRAVQLQAKVQPAPAVSPATLKADNQLLSAIDGELRADEATPATMYGLTVTSRGVRTRAPKRISN
jgi:hypothetical protein